MFYFVAHDHETTKNPHVTVSEDEANIFYNSANLDNFCGSYNGSLPQYYTLITCNPAITGQFVQIQLYTTTQMSFYEVEVHGV